jgi:hypothetical protein
MSAFSTLWLSPGWHPGFSVVVGPTLSGQAVADSKAMPAYIPKQLFICMGG